MPHTLRSIVPDKPLCAKEAAQMLGCSVRTLSKLMNDGLISGWRHGDKGRWHFDRLEVLLYIQRRKAQSEKNAKAVEFPALRRLK